MRRSLMMVLAAVMIAATVAPARAHEARPVGQLRVVVGWLNEPAIAGSLNAVQVRITRGTTPVTAANLRAQVTFGDESTEQLALAPAFNEPGEYRAYLVPTRPGSYAFRISGRADGQRFDQRFESGEDTFDDVSPPSEIEFPVSDPSRGELRDRLDRTDERLVAATDSAGSARSSATIAMILGGLGLVLGLIALVVALRGGRATA